MTSVAMLRGKRREWLVAAWAGALALLGLALVIALVAFALRRDDLTVRIGTIDQFPPGSVTLVQLDTTLPEAAQFQLTQSAKFPHAITSPIPVYIVHDRDGQWYAWYQRDPRTSCVFSWQPAEQLFIDPCHGSAYGRNGEYVRGPSARNLNGFRVAVGTDGSLAIDPRTFTIGKSVQSTGVGFDTTTR